MVGSGVPPEASVTSKEMTPTAVAKVSADLNKQERMLRQAHVWDPSGGLFDVHKKIAGSTAFDLLTSDGAGVLAGAGEPPAFTAFMKGTEPLMGRTARGVVDQFEGHGIGRVLKQREELEAKLMRATGGGTLMHDIVPVSFPDAASVPAALIASPPAVATPFVDYRPPIVVPKRRSVQPIEPAIVPIDLAEVSAGEEARSNRIAVEELLRDTGLDYELEHFDVISARLISGTRPDRIHAAMSANLLFEGVANFVFPGQEEKYVDRNGSRRSVKNEDVRNRVSAFIDRHLSREMSTHEARRLQGMIDFAHKWSAKGHHVYYSAAQANLAYRDLLVVLAYVARAHGVGSR
jgi:hypothetical protein